MLEGLDIWRTNEEEENKSNAQDLEKVVEEKYLKVQKMEKKAHKQITTKKVKMKCFFDQIVILDEISKHHIFFLNFLCNPLEAVITKNKREL